MRPLRRAVSVALLFALALAGCGRMGDPIPPGEALLSAPATPTAAGRENRILLRWSAPKTTVGGKRAEAPTAYRVERSQWAPGETPCETCPEAARTAGTVDAAQRRERGEPAEFFSDAALTGGWTYRYRVYPVDDRGREGRPSAPVTISWHALPAPVVHAEPMNRGARILVDASPVAPPPYSFSGLAVYDADGRLRLQLPAGTLAGEILDLPNDRVADFTCRWALAAPDGATLESAAAPLSVTPRDLAPPEPPRELIAMGETRAITLHWLPAVGEPYALIVLERAPEGAEDAAWTELARLPGNTLSYADRGLAPGARYRYRAVALDAAGNPSAPSPVSAARSLGP